MALEKIRRILVLSTTLVFSISIFTLQETTTSPGYQSVIVDPESSLVFDNSGSRSGPAAVSRDDYIELAGNAPCNPEQEVCNK